MFEMVVGVGLRLSLVSGFLLCVLLEVVTEARVGVSPCYSISIFNIIFSGQVI